MKPSSPLKKELWEESAWIQKKYEIISEIGKGTFGKIYRVRDKANKKELALKVQKVLSKEELYKAMEEINNILSMDHPNIIKYYKNDFSFIRILGTMQETFAEDYHAVFQVMPLADRNLKVVLEKKVSRGKKIQIVEQILAGLIYAHKEQICHLDLKLENFLDFNGTIKICDWGSGKRNYENKSYSLSQISGLSMTSWPPEIVQHEKNVNFFKVDSYAMGIIFM